MYASGLKIYKTLRELSTEPKQNAIPARCNTRLAEFYIFYSIVCILALTCFPGVGISKIQALYGFFGDIFKA
jgi:hypothetical protein